MKLLSMTASRLWRNVASTDDFAVEAVGVYFDFSAKSLKGMRLRAMWRLYQFCRKEQFDVVMM